jgi:lysophospholipid acyltransferase (LPLAT)-like uncharacterized protein
MKRWLLRLLPPVGALFVRFLYLTAKKRFHLPAKMPAPDQNVVIAFWHGELLMQPFLYRKFRPEGHKAAVMVSEHSDGEFIVQVVRRFGVEAVRGSSRRGGAKALIAALRKLKAGYDVGITPDGPRGPRGSVAPGVVSLAKKSRLLIYPFGYTPSAAWQLKSWDRFVIPKPFCTIDFYVGEPIDVEGLEESEAAKLLKSRLDSLKGSKA